MRTCRLIFVSSTTSTTSSGRYWRFRSRSTPRLLEWGVWGSLSKDNFKRYAETFDDDGQSKLGAMFSYFSSRLPGYPETLNETTTVHPRDGRQRPRVEFHSTSLHPLAVDQRDGISYERAIELASPAPHPNEA